MSERHPADVCIMIARAFRTTAAGMRHGTRYQPMSPKAWDAYADFLETLSAHIRDLERRERHRSAQKVSSHDPYR